MAQAATVSSLCGLVALATLLSAPALAQDPSQTDAETERSSCVRIMNINGYSSLDDQHLLLNASASRHYLVTTRRSCYGLERGLQVGLSFPDRTRICNANLEYIVVPDGGRCRISTIEEVESADAARALIATRAATSDEAESR